MTVVLEGMSPAQEQGWLVLLDLFANRRTDWTLIGGQMMFLLAVENGGGLPARPASSSHPPWRGQPWLSETARRARQR